MRKLLLVLLLLTSCSDVYIADDVNDQRRIEEKQFVVICLEEVEYWYSLYKPEFHSRTEVLAPKLNTQGKVTTCKKQTSRIKAYYDKSK